MDCGLLARMIQDLLQERSSVVLPEFGTFYTEEVPACFSDRGFTINPPYKKVIFRSGGEDDGVFLDFYLRSNDGVSDRLAANDYLHDFLSGLKQELCRSKSVTLPGLGRIRATRENNFFFVPDVANGLFPQFDLLEPLSLHSNSDEAVSEPSHLESAAEIIPVPESRKQTVNPPRSKVWLKIIVWILVIVAAAYLALIILGRVAPDVIDPLLYSEEELEIIRND